MPDSGFTIEQYQVLNAAIASGSLSVKYGDKEVTYRNLEEMMSIRRLMAFELGLRKGSRRTVGIYSKNWDNNNCVEDGSRRY